LGNEGEPGGEMGEVICRVLFVRQQRSDVKENMLMYIMNLSE